VAHPNPGNPLADLVKAALLLNLTKCMGCKRSNDPGNPDFADWVIKTFLVFPIGAKCPDCQTPEERADAVIGQAIGPKYKLDGIRLVQLERA
jgi:hypothetical protein